MSIASPALERRSGSICRAMSSGAATAGRAVSASVTEGRGEVVLAVEDNAQLRRVVSRQLLRTRLQGARGRERRRRARCARQGAAVDLLFTDVVMPGGMSGIELAAEAPLLRRASGADHLRLPGPKFGDGSAVRRVALAAADQAPR